MSNLSDNLKKEEQGSDKTVIKKDLIPHFFPTYRINRKLYPLPIIIAVIISGLLAYITYVEAGIQIDGGNISEEEFGAGAALINGLIFTIVAALSSFIIIFIIKRKGIDILKYIFGFSFGLIGFFLTLFFGQIIIYLLFFDLPPTPLIYMLYYAIYYNSFVIIGAFTILMLYKYFTSTSFYTKNFLVLYIGLLTGAFMGVVMPLWTTLAILIGISLWDIFAVLYKRGPIKEMIDMVSEKNEYEDLTEDNLKEKLESGEIVYDTSKLEIGIGDIAFYSMLTSNALVQSGNIIVMILTSIAIIVGTGITISGLKRNKILPGLPISIFLGIGMMLVSWYLISLIL